MSTPDVVVLQNVRLGFPKLFRAERPTPDSKNAKYGANFIIDPTTKTGKANVEKVKEAQRYAAKGKFGDKWETIIKNLEKNRRAFRDGSSMTNDEGEVYNGFEGMRVVVAGRNESQGRPSNLDRHKNPVTEEDGILYAGCYVDAVVSFYAVTGKERGGNGVFASLEVVRFRGDGEAFGGGISSDAATDLLDDLDDDDDGLDDSASGGDMEEDDDMV